jgi:hypothetical protein
MGSYKELKKVIHDFIQDARDDKIDFTITNLEDLFKETVKVEMTVVYHPSLGSKSIPFGDKKKYLAEGWYDSKADFPPERNACISPSQWAACDKLIRSTRGLTLTSFVEVMGLRDKDPKAREAARPIYNQVVDCYGDTIELVKYKNNDVYRVKES